MKKIILYFLLLGLITIAAAPVTGVPFKQLSGLTGTWSMQKGKGKLYEKWWKVNDTYLQNTSYIVRANGDTVKLESVALTETKDGIFYTSTVANQNEGKAVPFKLTSSANSKFAFENPEHDFPKRIVYEMVNKDSIHAFIDDGSDASSKRSHFYYSRQKQ